MSASAQLVQRPTYSKHCVLSVPSDSPARKAVVTSIAFSPEGKFLAVSSTCRPSQSIDGLVQVYSVGNEVLSTRKIVLTAYPTALAWCKSTLVIGDRTGDVTVADCDHLDPQASFEEKHWTGGEIRDIAANDNLVAIGTPAWVHVARLYPRSWHGPSSWYDERLIEFPGLSPSASMSHCPVAVSFTEDKSTLVVTYEHDGVILYDPRSGAEINRTPSASRMIGGSAFSPRKNTLAATNSSGGVDLYTLDAEEPKHERTIHLQSRGVKKPIPVAFIHGGAALLVGSTHGQARVITMQGSVVQSFPAEADQLLVQEISYIASERYNYIAFGTADRSGSGKNVVSIYRAPNHKSPHDPGQNLKKSMSVVTVVLLATVIWLAISFGLQSSFWRYSFKVRIFEGVAQHAVTARHEIMGEYD